MPGPGNILIKIGAEAGQALSELSSVNKSLGDTMSTSEKMGAGVKKAFVPAAAALGALGYAAIGATKAAIEDASAQEHLAGVLERTAGATQSQISATEDWISSVSRATGVADDQLRPALEKIVTATGDVADGQKLLQQALDISAASGKDLDTVSTAIAKGYTGQTTALAKLVPGLSEAAKGSKDFDVIMGELATTTGGAMADSADTAAGQMKILSNTTAELQESLGQALIPVIQAILPLLQKFADFASDNTTAIKVLIGVIASLAGGIVAANAVMKLYAAGQIAVKVATAAWTAAQWLLNVALEANPIGLVILAIAALAAGIVIAYTKSETFRSIVQAAFSAVKVAVQALKSAFDTLLDAAQSVWNWITGHWKVGLFALGPIGAAIYLLATNWDKVTAAAGSAADAISSAISGISSAISGVIDAIQSLIGWLGRIHVPKINLPGPFSVPVPGAASGAGSLSAGALSSSSAPAMVVNFYGAVDPESSARAIRRLLERSDRRNGRLVG